MSKLLRTLLPPVLLIVAVHMAAAQSLIPTPEFSKHQIPTASAPEVRSMLLEYLDLAALVVGLSLASLMALVIRSRRGLFLLAIVSLVWLGFWRKGCVCPIGAIQNVTLAMFDFSYAVPLTVVAFFTLPLVFTLFFGRTFCAAVCPLGAVQELVAVRPIRVPTWLDHTLGLLAYVYLGLAVLFAAMSTVDLPTRLICRYDPFVGFFRLGASVNMLVLGGCFLLVGVFVGRPYCRYLCPYGAILGLLSKVSKWHVQIPPEECIECRLCEEICPYGAIREPTVTQSARQRHRGRRRLAVLILLLPLLVVLGGWLGSRLAVPLSRLDPTVRLAERVLLEETGKVQDTTEASEALRNTGEDPEDLYREAIARRQRFAVHCPGLFNDYHQQIVEHIGLRRRAGIVRLIAAAVWLADWVGGAGLLGAWVGLVVGVKLIHLSIRRRRADYQPDRINCVACGRCFWYCPSEQARLGLIQDIEPAKLPRQ